MSEREESALSALLKQTIDSSLDGMALLDDQGQFQYMNDLHAALYGYDDPEQLVGKEWRILYDDEETKRFEEQIMSTLEAEGSWEGTAIGIRRDGEQFVQRLSVSQLPGGRLACSVRDISDRKERKDTLNHHETILKNIRDGVYTLNMEGEITWVNESVVEEHDIGYTHGELVGNPVSKILSDEDIETCMTLIQDLIHGDTKGAARCEVALQTAYGTEIPCELHITLLYDSDGRVKETVGVARDITERKRHEQRLSVLNRVLRHNLRNELNIIMGQSEWLAANPDTTAPEKIKKITSAARRLSRLGEKARSIEQTLEDAGEEQSVIDLAAVVEHRCERVSEQYPAATITVETPSEQPVVADATIDTVVDNLLENAVKHGSAEPSVTVSLTDCEASERVTLSVSDNGDGIPGEELDALQRDGETQLTHGTGLGLWFVRWLVDSYGGDVTFEQHASGGTTVTVALRAGEAAE